MFKYIFEYTWWQEELILQQKVTKNEIKITQELDKGLVKINFKDSGIGIPENEINQIFSALEKRVH
mgnify:CR=1 FL=1